MAQLPLEMLGSPSLEVSGAMDVWHVGMWAVARWSRLALGSLEGFSTLKDSTIPCSVP